MKTKKPLIILLVVFLLVGYYLMGTNYLKQRQQSEQLKYQIADATRVLALIPQPPADMEQQLASAQSNLTAIESDFPGRVNSTQSINAILKLADGVGVKAILLVTQPWSIEKKGVHDYYVLRLNVSVEGSFSQLMEFTKGLESSVFPTLIIEQLSTAKEVERGVAESKTPVTASLDLAIYTRSPPTD